MSLDLNKFYEWMRPEIEPGLWQHYNLHQFGDSTNEITGPVDSCVLLHKKGRDPEFMVLRTDTKEVSYGTYLVSLLGKYWVENAPSPGPLVLKVHGTQARRAVLNMHTTFDVQFQDGFVVGGDHSSVPPSTTAIIKAAK